MHAAIRSLDVVKMNETLLQYINALDDQRIDTSRKNLLDNLVQVLKQHKSRNPALQLNFICTHNSRRSVLAQVWAQTAAHFFGVMEISCYSGGTEATAVYPMIIQTLREAGVEMDQETEGSNPLYKANLNGVEMELFSKVYSHPSNPQKEIIAIMTCSHADENCPFIPGAVERFALTYDDPKISDGTPEQTQVYFDRSMQIANEMFYVFAQLKK